MTKAMLIPIDGAPEPVEYDGFADLQRLVQGDIEAVSWVFDDAPALYVNGSGKLDGQPPNRAVFADVDYGATFNRGAVHAGELLDILFGPIVAVGFDPETGEDRDISDAEIERVMSRFGEASIGSGLLAAMGVRLVAAYPD